MTLRKRHRENNNELALQLLYEDLGDAPISQRAFMSDAPQYSGIDRTTWEDLSQSGCVSLVGSTAGANGYSLTGRGWLMCLEMIGASQSADFMQQIGHIIQAMKRHVKGRASSALVTPWDVAKESSEPFGLVFNVIESRASSVLNSGRVGATWYAGKEGTLIEIPANFSMEPIDVAAGLTVKHLDMIEELEERLRESEEDRAQFHCPDCGSTTVSSGEEDIPDAHCIVMHEHFACGLHRMDGDEEAPCPFGPNWPQLEEFEFNSENHGSFWSCYAFPKTDRARRVSILGAQARTKEEAEAKTRKQAAPKQKGDALW